MWELPEVSNWILLTSVLQQVRGGGRTLKGHATPLTLMCLEQHRTFQLLMFKMAMATVSDPHPPPQVSRTANLRKLARIRCLYRDRRRRCFLFDDLHCVFTSGPAAAPWERWGER